MPTTPQKLLSKKQSDDLYKILKDCFEQNMHRHKGLDWAKVHARLEATPEKQWSLSEMEKTGGEPDIIGHDVKSGEYIFYDCSAESPRDRRSLCYDGDALKSRKENKPKKQCSRYGEGNGH